MSFRVGEFTLIFHGTDTASSPVETKGQNIGLSIHLSRTRLEPNRFIDGAVKVRNGGDRTGAQIELQLEGLPDTCYDLEPGPMLSSGADREVLLRIYHRGQLPLAGSRQVIVRAAAPKVYPGDEATASVKIDVVPQYSFSMRLLPPEKSLPGFIQVLKPRLFSSEPSEPKVETGAAVAPVAADVPAVAAEREEQRVAGTKGEDWWAPTAPPANRMKSSPKESVPAAPVSKAPANEAPPNVPPDSEVPVTSSQGVLSQPAGSAVEPAPVEPVTTTVEIAEPGSHMVETSPEPAEPPAVSVDEEQVPTGDIPDAALPQPGEASLPHSPDEAAEVEAPAGPPVQPEPEEEVVVEPQPLPEAEVLPQSALSTPAEEELAPEAEPPQQSAPVPPPPAPVDVDPSVVEVWWQMPASPSIEAGEETTGRGILRLSASTPPETKSSIENQPRSMGPSQTWWIPEEEDLTPPPEGSVAGRSVLKMKAQPPSRQSMPNQPPQEPRISPVVSEDWWMPSDDTEDGPDV